MTAASVLLIITRRDEERDYRALLNDCGVEALIESPCVGTASPGLLSLLGLTETEKTLMCAVSTRENASRVIRRSISRMGINLPGNGVALTLPMGSIGGERALNALIKHPDENKDAAEGDMEKTRRYPYDLVVIIAKQGSAEQVMNAARKAGARGGTIVHAKGTGKMQAVNLFGLPVAAEKEMLLIVTRHEEKSAIMRAVMEDSANHEDPPVSFSMPVEEVAGLRSVMAAEDI